MLTQQTSLISLPEWYHMLQDIDALIQRPTKHHRELLRQAYALRDAHIVDAGTLVEMVELANEALAYAHESVSAELW